MEPKKVSRKLLTRLPIYLDYVKSLPDQTVNISATSMANALGLGDVLVRKDLAKVSNGGRCKLGYSRQQLTKDIEDFLDINSLTGAIIVGAGKLGQALLDYTGFEASGMSILAGFDLKPSKKRSAAGKPIYTMEKMADFCRSNNIHIGIITVPAGEAQTVCDRMIACGIDAIWNFAPAHLNVPEGVVLQSENLAVSLTALRLQLKRQEDQKRLSFSKETATCIGEGNTAD